MTDSDLRYISKDGDRWRVRIPYDGQRLSLGTFDDLAQAIGARDNAVASSPETPQRTIDAESIDVPGNAYSVTTSPLNVSLDKWLYASDLHCPYHNREWIKRLILVANRHSVDTLVIGGDVFDLGVISRYPKVERQSSLNETLRIGGDLLVALGRYFQHIYLLPGNHDNRMAIRLDTPLDFEALIHASIRGRIALDRFTITNYDYMTVDNWIVGHPRFYSSIPARGMAQVAQLQQSNVIGAHNHLVGMMQSADGKYWAIDPGHMSDASLTPYMMQSAKLSRFSAWRNGFVMIEDGRPTLFSNGLVDWGPYGC
jgi:predicted phosphodiesterase